jgi:YrhK-like protein
MLSASGYAAGTVILVPASILLFLGAGVANWSIGLFIAATSLLTLAALADVASLFAEQRRTSAHYRGSTNDDRAQLLDDNEVIVDAGPQQWFRRWFINVCMVNGGLLFLAGSILFWPSLGTAAPGVWVFRVGSLSYLAGSLTILQGGGLSGPVLVAVIAYVLGALLYLLGGLLSEMHLGTVAFSSAWLAGSVLFATGGLILLKVAYNSRG